MSDKDVIIKFLKEYDGEPVRIMEVCGSHTGAISKLGIREMISDKIKLISGPGCPVCVTPSAYIDKLIDLALNENKCIVTFGDLLRVPGSTKSLSMVKGQGARVEMIYSPLDIIDKALKEPDKEFVFAAVGFETTTPVYAILMEQLVSSNIKNVKLLTAIKTMPEVIDSLCAGEECIDGFLAPGHVCVVTGSKVFQPLADKYNIPFGVAGFSGEEILSAIYGIVNALNKNKVMNFYPSVVTKDGNVKAKNLVNTFFEKSDAVWRGIGKISNSGLILKSEYEQYDAGSYGLNVDVKLNKGCRCDEVLVGKITPKECPLFGKVCNPYTPQGACMVSTEGTCCSYYSGM